MLSRRCGRGAGGRLVGWELTHQNVLAAHTGGALGGNGELVAHTKARRCILPLPGVPRAQTRKGVVVAV